MPRRFFIPFALCLLACRPSAGVPLIFSPTPALPPASDTAAFRAAIVNDRNQFLDTIRSRIAPLSKQAVAARTNSGRYTYTAIIVGLAGAVLPLFINSSDTKTHVAQTGSALGAALAAAIGFHKYDERGKTLENCVWHLNSAVVSFSTKWADSAFASSAAPRDTTWRAYAADKATVVADIRTTCPATGRYVGGP